MVIWLTGLAASGKTTIGRHLFGMWRARAANTVIVDGDDIRKILRLDKGDEAFTVKGRRAVAERICDLCAWLDRQDINVVCCTISFFDDLQRRNRETLSRYFEVFIAAPMDVLYRRDTKNLYAPALRGETRNVIGVDIPFTPPASPDLTVDNSEDRDGLEEIAADILARAMSS